MRWQDPHDDTLRAHVESGVGTYATYTSDINAKFGLELTRNAVIGRAKRMGWIMANPQLNGNRRREKAEPKPRIRKPAIPKPTAKLPELPAWASPVRVADVVPLNVTLLELGPDDCRYPFGDSEFLFCGHPKIAGSYCLDHFHLTRKVSA